jgi:hypothetical protein
LLGVLMFEQVAVDRGRRAILGAAGGLILQTVLQVTTASGQAAGPKMKIGIIGAGHIGGTIGELWTKAGYPVFFSSRHPEELQNLVARLGPLAQAGTVDQAIGFGDVVFIAVPYGALPQIGKDYGKSLTGQALHRHQARGAQRPGAQAITGPAEDGGRRPAAAPQREQQTAIPRTFQGVEETRRVSVCWHHVDIPP